MGSPVCGLRPMRAFRLDFTRRPRPGITNTPFFLVSLIAVSARCSRNAAAVLLFVSSFSAMCRTSWVLVIPDAIFPPYCEYYGSLVALYTLLPKSCKRFDQILCGFFKVHLWKTGMNSGDFTSALSHAGQARSGKPVKAQHSIALAQD